MKIFTFAALMIVLLTPVAGEKSLRHTQEQVSQGVFEDDCSENDAGVCCCGTAKDKYCVTEGTSTAKRCRPSNYVFCYVDWVYTGVTDPYALPWCKNPPNPTTINPVVSNECDKICPKK